MYNMSMFHSLLLNETNITGIGHLRVLLLFLVVVVCVGGEGCGGFTLMKDQVCTIRSKFHDQRRHPIYILVNRFLLYGGNI